MTNLPQRTQSNTKAQHVQDHNVLHAAVNELTEGGGEDSPASAQPFTTATVEDVGIVNYYNPISPGERALGFAVDGDTDPRVLIRADGFIEFGPGDSGVGDAYLFWNPGGGGYFEIFGPTISLDGGDVWISSGNLDLTGGGSVVLYSSPGNVQYTIGVSDAGVLTGVTATGSSIVTANRQTGNYTLVLSDAGKVVEMNVAVANTLTIPTNASVAFPIGTVLEGVQWGAGQTTLTPSGGVTIRSSGGKLKTAAQYAAFSLRKVATDEWIAQGELTT